MVAPLKGHVVTVRKDDARAVHASPLTSQNGTVAQVQPATPGQIPIGPAISDLAPLVERTLKAVAVVMKVPSPGIVSKVEWGHIGKRQPTLSDTLRLYPDGIEVVVGVLYALMADIAYRSVPVP